MLRNRPEFHLVDAAAMHLGAIPFSLSADVTPGTSPEIFDNTE